MRYGYLIGLSLTILNAQNTHLAMINSEELSFIKSMQNIKESNQKTNLQANVTKIDNNISNNECSYEPQEYLSIQNSPIEEVVEPKENNSSIENNSNYSYSYDPKKYLSLKEIVYPMPQDYAKRYLQLKTLQNPNPRRHIVKIYINKRRQRMTVYLDENPLYTFRVSTARRGYWTPRGVFRPYSLERMHYSRKYHNSPMPYSVFFKGGYAIHGTYSISHLGRPASHGCVRVHPRNAKKLYSLIRKYGKRNTKIVIY